MTMNSLALRIPGSFGGGPAAPMSPALSSGGAPMRDFASLFRMPNSLAAMAPSLGDKVRIAGLAQEIAASVGVDDTTARGIAASAVAAGIDWRLVLSQMSATPTAWSAAAALAPNPPGLDSVATWQPFGLGTQSIAAGATVTFTGQPQKRMVSRSLVIDCGPSATGVADIHDLTVDAVIVAGNTFTNGSAGFPAAYYSPLANTVAGTPNFAGMVVETSNSANVTLTNHGAEALIVSVGMIGPTV